LRFVLASASQGRYDTLVRAGVEPERIVSDVDEDDMTAASVAELAQTLAELKARDVGARFTDADEVLVLGCDSLLEFDGVPLGKPRTTEDARERWRVMRGRSGVLHTGHCLWNSDGRVSRSPVATTVHFADIGDDEIELYLSTGEPSRVAGAFTIDGYGGWFVAGVEGDPHNVVGLSLPALRAMLRDQGYRLRDLGYPSASGR
jgi:septum formation protein